MSDPNSHPAGSPSLLRAPHSPAGSKPRFSPWTLQAHLSLPEPFWTRWNHSPFRSPRVSITSSQPPATWTDASLHPPLAQQTHPSVSPPPQRLSLWSLILLPTPPNPNASSCCSQPLAALVLSPLQEKHPASQCPGLSLTLGRHPVLEMEEAPRTWGALSPVSREGASAHTQMVWVHEPTTPAHVHTRTSTHSPQTCTHTHANTQPLKHSHTLYTIHRGAHTHAPVSSLTIKGMSSSVFTRMGDTRLATRIPRGFAKWTGTCVSSGRQAGPPSTEEPWPPPQTGEHTEAPGHTLSRGDAGLAETHTWCRSCWLWLAGAQGTTRRPAWLERR